MILSLDLETYGACEHDAYGRSLPPQTQSHPLRSLYFDRIQPDQLILTATITLVEGNNPVCPTHPHLPPPGPLPSPNGSGSPLKSTNPVARVPASLSSATEASSIGWNGTSPHSISGEPLIVPGQTPPPPLTPSLWTPGRTFTLQLHRPDHRRLLVEWLRQATVLVGMHLQYDLLYLHHFPEYAAALSHQPTVFDLAHLIYLENPDRPERSLKTIGIPLGTHHYDRTISDHRFPSPHDAAFLRYCAEDTHNVVLSISTLARRIDATNVPDSSRLTLTSIAFFSAEMWLLVRMSQAGLPLSRSALGHLHSEMTATCEAAQRDALPLRFNGKGCIATQRDFLHQLITEIDLAHPRDPSVLNHPSLEYTPALKRLSFSETNRQLLDPLCPATSPLQPALQAWGRYTYASKLLSSYLNPLLSHRTTPNVPPFSTRLIPWSPASPFSSSSWPSAFASPPAAPTTPSNLTPPTPTLSILESPDPTDLWFAHPKWFPVPSPYKDDTSSTEGGQKQVRPSAKDPAAQTFPSDIKDCYTSRYGPEGTIATYDLAQIELRIAGLFACCPTLCAAFSRGEDLHTAAAIAARGPTIIEHPAWRTNNSDDPRKHYKAQPDDTLVPTPTGDRRLDSLNPGDLVFDSNGDPTEVLAVYPQGTVPVFRVRFSDNTEAICCEDHLWCIQTQHHRTRGTHVTLPLSAFRNTLHTPRGARRYFIPITAPLSYPPATIPLHPYVLGALLGDGSFRGRAIRFADKDGHIAARINACLLPTGERFHRGGPPRRDWSIIGAGRRGRGRLGLLEAAIRSLGLRRLKSPDKFIPPIYLRLPTPQRWDLLRGLLDTDGHCNRRVGSIHFTTASPRLAQDITTLVQSLGGIAVCCTHNGPQGSKYAANTYYQLRICLPDGGEPPFSHPDRLARWEMRTYRKQPCRSIVSVEPAGAASCRCIRVASPTACYLTTSHIVTHNTGNFLWLNGGTAFRYRATVIADSGFDPGPTLSAQVISDLDAAYSAVLSWRRRLLDEVHRTGRLEIPFLGHFRDFGFSPIATKQTNEVYNFLIQGPAAMINLYIQMHLHYALPPDAPCHLFLNTYDATSFDVRLDFLPTLRLLYKQAVAWVSSPAGPWGRFHALLSPPFPVPLLYDEKLHP